MPQHPGRVNLQVRFPDLQCGASLAEATTEIPLPPAVSISTQPFCDSLFGTELDTHTWPLWLLHCMGRENILSRCKDGGAESGEYCVCITGVCC